MLTQFGSTAESFSKASTMVFRIGTDAHLYDDPDDVSIAPLLDSKFDSEKCEALKRLLALIAQGFDVSSYFPQVVKNVASQSVEVKKLVYFYLLHYAEKRPNEALLSINCFQKDFGDPNPLVRAWALRTMAGIRLHVIAPLVLVAVGKCARDPSVYVRKCAAIALPKLHDLRLEEHTDAIEEIAGMLLKDNSPGVVGAAAAAFASICPNNFSLIGRNYRRLCETLPDVEEWGQIVLIVILLRYAIAKHGLVEESLMLSSDALPKHKSEKEDSEPHLTIGKPLDGTSFDICTEIADIVSRSYLEGPDKYLSQLGHVNRDLLGLDGSHVTSAKSNDDVKILLQCTLPLLWSYNSAVVLAAAGVHWIMAPKEDIPKIVKPLLFLLRSSSSSKYVVLCNIQVFAKAMPSLFSPYFEDFFISSSDSYQIKTLKLEILSSIASSSSISSIFLEFQDYIRDPDRKFAADTVATIGLCAQRLPDVANTCLEGLLFLALSESSNRNSASLGEEEIVLVQVIKSIKTIIKQDPQSHERVIVHLARSLDSMHAPAARAMVIWMLGEYSNIGSLISKMIPTIFKYFARRFTLEAVETKLQIINAGIKVLLRAKEEDMSELRITVAYVLELAKCDLNYDVRDRARVLKNFLSHCTGLHDLEKVKDQTEFKDLTYVLADYIFGGQTKAPCEPFSYRFYLPGSLSQIVLHAAPGYEPLPEPCSIVDDETGQSPNTVGVRATDIEPNEANDSDATSSGSMDEENTSDYSSQGSFSGSSGGCGSYNASDNDDENEEAVSLIHLSDGASTSRNHIEGSVENSSSGLMDFGEFMSKRALESWLNENPGSSKNPSDVHHVQRSFARISIKDIGQLVKPKSYTLLDPANGNGLSVDYRFSSEVSSISPQLVCLQVSFKNNSTEPMSNILLAEEESKKGPDSSDKSLSSSESSSGPHSEVATLVPMEEIGSLNPGQTINRTVQVRFEHHLLPLKLDLWCNGRKQQVKLRPDIGYFIKPLSMDVEAFSKKESQLPGMFECIRRCTFTDHISQLNVRDDQSFIKDNFLMICEKLALKMLSNANLFLVSVDMSVAANLNDLSGLCLRFSGEILSNSMPCLVTLTLKGTCSEPLEVSVKINCEETVFGLNLLNRIVNFLAEQTL
ncbi:Vesicle coat complex AP-3, beta subunit [Handroanthus impetiginosus]|uniref:AP-3 complex subunit beta n=1 Tax=Handroanthus impetiginosus TaxID=429701 RepID=A0A2G9H3S8_9LAMI|nr:Vesicle coat complex AP-3, beta subunit [Handroanthus impetiginosus]